MQAQIVNNTYSKEVYVLYQCGTDAPNAELFPGAKFFSIPLVSVSVDDTSIIAFMVRLQISPCG